MRMRRPLVLLPLAVSIALLTGCTGENAQPVGAQSPDPVSEDALLVSLESVAPGLGDQSSIDDADTICSAIEEGDSAEDIDELFVEIFSDQAEGELTIDDARNGVVVITTDYCGE